MKFFIVTLTLIVAAVQVNCRVQAEPQPEIKSSSERQAAQEFLGFGNGFDSCYDSDGERREHNEEWVNSNGDSCICVTGNVHCIDDNMDAEFGSRMVLRSTDCTANNKCNRRNGKCITRIGKCQGYIVPGGCTGANNCKCCAPIGSLRCPTYKRCSRHGGTCQPISGPCSGKMVNHMCTGTRCGCCIPN